jgi:S-phase kinase-associated protein 1
VTVRAALMSNLIKGYLQDYLAEVGEGEVPPDLEVPLPDVNYLILDKVVQYISHHVDDLPNQPAQPVEFISDWDRALLGILPDNSVPDKAQLYELIKAANYLEIKPFLEVTTKAAANMLRGKTTEQMKVILGVRN